MPHRNMGFEIYNFAKPIYACKRNNALMLKQPILMCVVSNEQGASIVLRTLSAVYYQPTWRSPRVSSCLHPSTFSPSRLNSSLLVHLHASAQLGYLVKYLDIHMLLLHLQLLPLPSTVTFIVSRLLK
eukprot:4424339-Pleurochrysis_carterae.AAC.1